MLCASSSTLIAWMTPSMLFHNSNSTILAWYGCACFEKIQPCGVTYFLLKFKNVRSHKMCAINTTPKNQVSLYGVPQFQRHHTNLEMNVPASRTFNHAETNIFVKNPRKHSITQDVCSLFNSEYPSDVMRCSTNPATQYSPGVDVHASRTFNHTETHIFL